MRPTGRRPITVLVAVLLAVGLIWVVYGRFSQHGSSGGRRGASTPVPVEVATIEHGPIEFRRTFNGALEPTARFVVAPKVSGRVERLSVDISDMVNRGQIVAELDNDEYVQAVAQAKADLAVAKANLVKARSAVEIAGRELIRIETLRKRGVTSESQLDEAKAAQLANKAELEVAKAQVTRAESSLETANIRLGYTRVTADWTGGNDRRVVAERYVDEGQTITANTSLLSIVELQPITGVIFVTEKDYTYLHPGQRASLTTDAYPGERFEGRIDRIAPIFQESTRQARVELTVENPQQRLKPGTFIRATVVLHREEDAVIIPEQALTERNDESGVFVVNEEGTSVAWRTVREGIRQEKVVQVHGEGLTGRVVTLGQQLLDDGSAINITGQADLSPLTGTSTENE